MAKVSKTPIDALVGKVKEGRPSIYTDELAELVCERIAKHPEGIRKICKMFDDMPDDTTIYEWMYKNPEFSRRFLKAREQRAHTLFHFSQDLADSIEDHQGYDKDGFLHVDSGLVACYKMRVTNLQKHAEKYNPEYYGQKEKTEDKAVADATRVLSESLEALVKSKEKPY